MRADWIKLIIAAARLTFRRFSCSSVAIGSVLRYQALGRSSVFSVIAGFTDQTAILANALPRLKTERSPDAETTARVFVWAY